MKVRTDTQAIAANSLLVLVLSLLMVAGGITAMILAALKGYWLLALVATPPITLRVKWDLTSRFKYWPVARLLVCAALGLLVPWPLYVILTCLPGGLSMIASRQLRRRVRARIDRAGDPAWPVTSTAYDIDGVVIADQQLPPGEE